MQIIKYFRRLADSFTLLTDEIFHTLVPTISDARVNPLYVTLPGGVIRRKQ